MNIAEFSRRSGLSAHTLRYYEKLGLLTGIQRNNAGHRLYRESDIEWAAFINRLKDTGMPLKDIIRYSTLRAAGEPTMKERQQMLTEHRIRLQQRITEEQQHLKALDKKIAWYEEHS